MSDLLTALRPVLEQYPVLVGPVVTLVLMTAFGSTVVTAGVMLLRFVASQPRVDSDTARIRAETQRIAAQNDAHHVERLSEQIDRLERENDRLVDEGDKLLERLEVCQRTSRRLEAQFASLEERWRVLAEWVESEGGDVSQIIGSRAS